MKKLLMTMLALLCVFSITLTMAGCNSLPDETEPSEMITEPVTDPTEESTVSTEPPADTTLADAKTAAKAALDSYAKAEDYRDAQKTELATAIANGKAAIDAAADTAAVDAALASAKTAIDGIKTDAELTAEEELAAAEALAAAKTAAKAQLDAYADADDYRDAQKTELATAITNGKAAIDAAADTAAIDAALASAKAVVDDIKTDAELTAEEELAAEALAAAKTAAKAQLDTYADADDYRDAQKTELATAIANGKAAIDAATDTAAVNAALASAKTVIDAIETDAEITAKSPKITTTMTNGMTFTNSKATLDVWVKDSTGSKLDAANVTVTVNGTAATINWDDHEKTSYNFVFTSGENTVVITAVDGTYSTTVTYVVNCNLTAPTTITVAVEGFTIGLDYIIAPYKLVLDENTLTEMASMYGYADAAEMKENLTAAYVLDYTLQIHGLTMDYQGGLASGNGFYMSAVSGLDTSNIAIPDELQVELENNGYTPEPYVYEEGTLGEFDITWGSGWMYFINNVAPNVGFCDYVPQDGDVMRVQFTLAYGADIGSTMVGATWFEDVDRDALTQCIADAIEAGVDYSEALEVISTFGVTQDELDAACEALESQLNG